MAATRANFIAYRRGEKDEASALRAAWPGGARPRPLSRYADFSLADVTIAYSSAANSAGTTMLRRFFGRKDRFGDAAKSQFAAAVADLLELQMIVAVDESIEDDRGQLKRKALGYVYGYIDAALRMKGLDMADVSIGVPITFHVLRRLWPDHANKCMDYLVRNLQSDALMVAGMMHGGQQFFDYSKPEATGAPMGLARFMIEGDRI